MTPSTSLKISSILAQTAASDIWLNNPFASVARVTKRDFRLSFVAQDFTK
jgi:hypothetical protein